jgi:hypothetical protein
MEDTSKEIVELGTIEPIEPSKGREILDQYIENLKVKANSRISSCLNCGSQTGQLVRADRKDKSKGYVCVTCIKNYRAR